MGLSLASKQTPEREKTDQKNNQWIVAEVKLDKWLIKRTIVSSDAGFTLDVG